MSFTQFNSCYSLACKKEGMCAQRLVAFSGSRNAFLYKGTRRDTGGRLEGAARSFQPSPRQGTLVSCFLPFLLQLDS